MSQKINWEETCSKCIYGSTATLLTNAKGKCSHKNPKTHFDEDTGWMCDSFRRRWAQHEDIALSRDGL